jgi:hypothetical protein
MFESQPCHYYEKIHNVLHIMLEKPKEIKCQRNYIILLDIMWF